MSAESDFRKEFLQIRRKLTKDGALSRLDERNLHLDLLKFCLQSIRTDYISFENSFSLISGLKILPLSLQKELLKLQNSALKLSESPSVITSMLEMLPDHSNLAESNLKYADRHTRRKKTGSFYTPLNVADFMSSIIIDEYLSQFANLNCPLRILDPAVGGGVFLDSIFSELKSRGLSDQKIIESLFAVDRDPNSLDISIEMLKIKSPDSVIPKTHFFNGDFLLDDINHPSDGYNIIIGNPPYISYYSRGSHSDIDHLKSRLKLKYGKSAGGSLNTFLHFLVRSIEILATNGLLCFILPDKILWNRRYRVIRNYILDNSSPLAIFTTSDNLFHGAVVSNTIILLKKGRSILNDCIMADFSFSDSSGILVNNKTTTNLSNFTKDNQIRFVIKSKLISLIDSNSIPLGEIAHVRDGINPAFADFRQKITADSKINERYKPLIEGSDIRPFYVKPRKIFINYDPSIVTKNLQNRGVSFREKWIFTSPLKLVNRQTSNRLVFALDENCLFSLNSVHNTIVKDDFLAYYIENNQSNSENNSPETKRACYLFLLGLLNSRLMNYYYQSVTKETSSQFPQVHIADLKELPVRLPDYKFLFSIARISDKILKSDGAQQINLHYLDQSIYQLYELSSYYQNRIVNSTGKEWRI